jgi:hypothetical protein
MFSSFIQMWKDEFLTWGAKDFGGVSQIHVAANEVWLPDVVLFNRSVSETV